MVTGLDLIREQVLSHTREEVPHSVAVSIDRVVDDGPRTAVLATVLVERTSQKGILIGKGGQTIKTLSMEARTELSELLERPVHLFLFVKVRENWGDDPERYRELGLDYPKG